MKLCSLYRGSSGNSLFIQGSETKILVDSGVSAKKVEEALDSINIDIKEINAILVTHEHIDHIRSLRNNSKKTQYTYICELRNLERYRKRTKSSKNRKQKLLQNRRKI